MIRSRVRDGLRSARLILLAQLRTLLPVGAVVIVGVVVLMLLAATYAELIGVTAYDGIVANIKSGGDSSGSVIAITIPLLLLALFASLVWAGTAVRVAHGANSSRRSSTLSAVGSAVRRSPKAFAVIALTTLAVLAAIITTPLLVIAGIVGLIIDARGRPNKTWWPQRERLIAMAIPLGVAVLVLVRWSLALSGVWLRGLGVRASLADSSQRVRGRGPEVAVLFVLALGMSFGLTQLALTYVQPLVGGPLAEIITAVVALILVGSLPLTTLAVLSSATGDDRATPLAAPTSRRGKVAAAVVAALIIPMVVVGAPVAANAAATTVTVSADSSTTVVGEELTLTAQVTGNAPTGNVTFVAKPSSGPNVQIALPQAIDGTGKTSLQYYHLPAGVYTIVADYAGDAHNPATESAGIAHTVNLASTTTTVTASPTWTAAATTLTATVAAVAPAFVTPTGSITVTGGGHSFGPVTLDGSGVASVPVNVVTAGTRDLTVTYSGDSAYKTSGKAFSVPAVPTTMNVFGDLNRAATYGDSETFEGSVTAADHSIPTGKVDIVWYNDQTVASGMLDASGNFSITTSTMRVSSQHLFVLYEGTSTYASSDNSASPINLELAKATSVPVISISPAQPGIGGTVTVTATLANLGSGPTGTITFEDGTGAPLTGPITVSNGIATTQLTIAGITTYVKADYSGDINFKPETSDVFTINADRAAAAVSILDPGTLTYGQTFDLTATISVGGGTVTPDHGVDFTETGGTVVASDVPVISGKATFTACAGAAVDCPDGTVALGANPTNIVASYAESSVNQLGQSAPYFYSAGKAATTTSLSFDPTEVLYGSGVNLTATVTSPGSSVTPTGTITFYGVTDGGSLNDLGNADLIDGQATLTTQFSNTLGTLIWPENGIEAFYNPDGANFLSSTDTEPVTLDRVGVTVDVQATPQPAGTPTTITVLLTHDPGASENFTGTVTITPDVGGACLHLTPAAGQRTVSCQITWTGSGNHSVEATYSGDLVYAPGDSGVVPITSGKGTPNLGVSVASTTVVGQNVTVTWNQFDAGASGTVSVWGDGTQWCSNVSVQQLSCSGAFGAASATGSPVQVVVQYTGDSNWNPVEQDRNVTVTACATLDVRSTDTSLGTVTVNTPSNCGSGGYAAGTTVSITATPKAPAVFSSWLQYNLATGNLVPGSSAATTSFVVGDNSLTWVQEAVFTVPCESLTASAVGYGGIFVTPSSNCTTTGGDPGYKYGTHVAIYPDGHYDPTYGENDAFRSFGTLPSGASFAYDSSHRIYLSMTVTAPTVIPVTFGPVCRPVTITFDPSSTGDSINTGTPLNCFSPFGNGYLNGTTVNATVQPGDPTLAISEWLLNGSPDAALGTTSTPSVVVDTTAPVLTAELVHCYSLTVNTDGVFDRKNNQVGDVRIDGTPNCPDGSKRYTSGSIVTLTPEILVSGGSFNGWDDVKVGPVAPAAGTGDVTQYARTLTLTSDVDTTAGFYLDSSCSKLTVIGDTSLISFPNSGCGPGSYADIQKQVATSTGVDPSTLWQDKYHSQVTVAANRTQPMDVYVSLRSDTRSCFGTVPSSAGPSTANPNDWQTFGPLKDNATCGIAGDTTIWPQACQTFSVTPVFVVAGDTTGTTYDASSMPGTFYLEGYDGQVHAYTMTGFNWAQMTPLEIHPGGKATYDELAPGPCHDAGDAFPAKTFVSLKGVGPTNGFQFSGWSGGIASGISQDDPLISYADGLSRRVTGTALYTVSCHTLTLDAGITVIGDAPRCPGTDPSANSYIAGSAVEVQAAQKVGDRWVSKFTTGVIAGQIYQDPDTKALTGFAVVDGDKKVAATYLTDNQLVGTGILQGLKFTSGFFAVAAPIVLGMFFPPAGIALAILGVGAGVLGQIPGAGQGAAVFNMLNPTTFTTCAARWAFNNSGDPSGGANLGSAISLTNTMKKANQYADLVNEPVGPVGAAGGLASFGLGLYTAGVGNADLSPTTVDQLADSSTMTNCLSDQWGGGGSNLDN